MSNATYFTQECPTCGRRLEIRVEHLGRNVVCQHCRGRFVARDPASNRYAACASALMDRADQLLEEAAPTKDDLRVPHPR